MTDASLDMIGMFPARNHVGYYSPPFVA
jgi:hypothetical protein